MGGLIHLPQLAIQQQQPTDPLEKYGQLLSIQKLAASQQLQQSQIQNAQLDTQAKQLEVAQAQRDAQDAQTMRTQAPNFIQKDDSGKISGFDANGYYNSLLSNGVPINKVSAIRMGQAQMSKALADSGESNIKLADAKVDSAYNVLEGVRAAAKLPGAGPNTVQGAYQDALPKLQQLGFDTSQYPQSFAQVGDAGLQRFEAELGAHKQIINDAKNQAEIGKNTSAQAASDVETQLKQAALARGPQPTETSLAVKAAAGDPDAEAALKRLDQSKRAGRTVIGSMSGDDVKSIADAIQNGDQPPTVQGLYRNAGPVRAELARRGVPLAQMETDWKATQKYVGTLNGTQQTRLRQAISTASDSLDKIDSLYQEYHSIVGDAGMKVFNKAGLLAAKNLPGRAGAVATALDAQIADVTSELGNVYMGGNSPTDHSLSLAGKNLSSDWNRQTFEEAIKQAHLNLGIRKNSILHAEPAGLSGNTDYFPNQDQSTPTHNRKLRAIRKAVTSSLSSAGKLANS